MKAVFVDESKSKNYILCAVFVELTSVPEIRHHLNTLRLKGQNRVHFVSESDSRRRYLLSQFRKISMATVFIVSQNESEKVNREACLRALVRFLDPLDRYQIWIETDLNHIAQDETVLISELNSLGIKMRVDFYHESSRQHQLLWLPDALAWAKNRGGVWSKELESFSTQTIKL